MTDQVEDLDIIDPVLEEPKTEKMISVSRAEELIKKAKLKGRDQMTDENEALRRKIEELENTVYNVAPVDFDLIEKRAEEVADRKIQQMREEDEANVHQRNQESFNQELAKKAEAGFEKYSDFAEALTEVEINKFKNALLLVNQTDNVPDVLYELAKNPMKLHSINEMAKNSPGAAMSVLKKLSKSIKDNDNAVSAGEREVKAPTRRLQSSNVGADNGAMEIKDYKSKYLG